MYESAGQFLQPGSHRAVDDQIISLQACTANQALVQIELQIYFTAKSFLQNFNDSGLVRFIHRFCRGQHNINCILDLSLKCVETLANCR